MGFILLDGKTLHEQPQIEFPTIIEGLLVKGATILAGEPKVGKSTIAMQWAHAVATNQPALGRFPVNRPGNVLYCPLEEPVDILRERQHRIDPGSSNWQRIDFLVDRVDVAPGGPLVKLLDEQLDRKEYAMLVLDPFVLAREVSRTAHSYDADYHAMAAFNELANRHKISVVVVHHTNKKKESGEGQSRINGTTGLAGAATTNMVLSSSGGNLGKLEISSRCMRGASRIFRKGEDGLWVADSSENVIARAVNLPTSSADRIKSFIATTTGFSSKDLAEVFPDIPPGTRRSTISKLVHDGVIRQTKRGNYQVSQQQTLVGLDTRGEESTNNEEDLPLAA